MNRFKCKNENCGLFDMTTTVYAVKYVMNKENKLIPSIPVNCEMCGLELEEIKEVVDWSKGSPAIGKFGSLDAAGKRKMIHERAQKHQREHGDEQKKMIKAQIIKKAHGW
jgi:hypothetical protein